MKRKLIYCGIILAFAALWAPSVLRAEPTNEVTVVADIPSDTTWYRTNVYLLDGYVHVLAPATLTIESGTVIKGLANPSTGEATSALFITAGAKINAVGTPTQPIIFTAEIDDTSVPDDLGIYQRGLWGGVVLMGKAVLNTASNADGNAANPKYDVFEGLPDNQIGGQFVYRFGGNDDADNSGVLRYVSIRHGGFQFLQNKELNGLSLGAVGSGTTIDHVEVYAFADDGFEFFGGTVNTKYLVSAFNDDDAFDTDQGYRGKNQFWFAIQENGKRDSGGEWNGEPSGIAVSNAPLATFEVYNGTWIGAGSGAGLTTVNHGLTIREYSSPRVYNSILTDFNQSNAGTIGINISDARSGAMLTAGLLDLRENIVHGFNTVASANATVLFTDASRSNSTVNPLLVSISRSTNQALDPRLQPGSPALNTTRIPPNDGFYEQVAFKGAFDESTLWLKGWTTLDALGFLPSVLRAEPTNEVTVVADIPSDTTWYRTNVYLLDGYVHVLAPATLTIESGTVIKGLANPSTGEATSALFITAGAKINAVGTPTQPIIFTAEIDDTSVPDDLGIYQRGLWGGVVLMGKAVLNTASNADGNAANPKYDVFEGLPDNQIGGQFVYRFGGNDDADNSGVLRYVSIRHGGFQFLQNKELNGLSLGAVGSGTTIDHVEVYAFADDGFEFFGGTVNTKYLVSAFNDDDAFDTDQGYRGKNQFWFAIQENGKRDSGGEWNGEPSGIAVSNAPLATFEVYNGTWIGAGSGAGLTTVNHGLTIREYSSPRVYNSILTDFNQSNAGTIGINISDARSGAMLTAGLLDLRENIVHGFNTVASANATVLFTDASRSNSTVNPLLVSISRSTNQALDPRLQPGSPALNTGRLPNDAFYSRVGFKGALNRDLWLKNWTTLDQLGFLPVVTEITPEKVVASAATPDAPLLTIRQSGGNIEISHPSQAGFSYQLESADRLPAAAWTNESTLTGTGSVLTHTLPIGTSEKYFRVLVQ